MLARQNRINEAAQLSGVLEPLSVLAEMREPTVRQHLEQATSRMRPEQFKRDWRRPANGPDARLRLSAVTDLDSPAPARK